MTRPEEEAAWSRVFREIPEKDVQAEIRSQRTFNICVSLLILMAVVSLIYGLLSIGSAGLEMLQQGVTL